MPVLNVFAGQNGSPEQTRQVCHSPGCGVDVTSLILKKAPIGKNLCALCLQKSALPACQHLACPGVHRLVS